MTPPTSPIRSRPPNRDQGSPRANPPARRIAGEFLGSPLVSIEVRQLGGELARPQRGGGARSAIAAPYALFAVGIAPDRATGRAIRTSLEHLNSALAPWEAQEMYMNFAETRRDPEVLWGDATYRRLRRIKSEVDPEDLIRANHPISPA